MTVESKAPFGCPDVLRLFINRIRNSPVAYRLARGTFWSIAGTLISRGMLFCAWIVIARLLGKAVYGEFGMIQSTVGMFGIYAGFGLGVTATKHVAEYRKTDPLRAGRIIGLSNLVASITGGLMVLVLGAIAPWLAANTINAPHLAGALRIGGLILLFNALNGAQVGALAGFESFKTIAYINLIVGLTALPILVCGAHFGALAGALWAQVVHLTINCFINHFALLKEARNHGVPINSSHWNDELAVLWTFSFPTVVSSTMVAPVIWLCKSMLACQPSGYAGLGAFAVAESWRSALCIACQMIGQASFPVLSQLYGQGHRRQFKLTLLAQIWLNGAIVTAGVFGVIVLSNQIIAMYGSDFRDVSRVLIVVAISGIPMQLATVVGTVNKCVGNIWWGVLLNALWAIAYISSTSLLIRFGALGLAWSTLIAYTFHLLFSGAYALWVFRSSPKLMGDRAP